MRDSINNSSGNGYFKNGNYSNGTSGKGKSSSSDEIDLKHLFLTGWRYKWIIMILVSVSLVSSYFIAKSMTPIYQAESKMMIAEMRSRYTLGGSDLTSLLTGSFGIGMGSTIANELQILRSRRFLSQVADRLLENPYDEDGNLFPRMTQDDEGEIKLVERDVLISRLGGIGYVREDMESDIIKVTYMSPSPEEARLVVNTVIDTYYDFSTLENRQQSRAALAFLDGELEEVEGQLKRSEEELRDFMNRHGLVVIEEQSINLVNQLASLEAEQKRIEVQLVAATSALENYREELDTLMPGIEGQIASANSARISRYSFRLAELETQRVLLLTEYPELVDAQESEPQLAKLNRQINQLREEIASLAREVIQTDERFIGFLGDPDGNIAGKLGEIREQILLLDVEQKQLMAQKDMIDQSIERFDAQFAGMPDNMLTYMRLYREQRMNEQIYLTVAKQTSELKVWEQTQLGYGRIVDYAIEPVSPVRPRTVFFLLGGFLIGGFLSIGYIVTRETMTTEIKSVDYLRSLGYQLLAVIPDIGPVIKKNYNGKKRVNAGGSTISTDLTCVLDPVSPISESYRRLFNNVLYSQPDTPFKTIVVTSAGQGEGKSTTLANMAIAIAESGRSVVLVDCDFRRPRVYKQFGIDEEPGVSDWLFDEKELEDITVDSIVPGLKLLPTGKKVANPSSLVQSNKMHQLVSTLQKTYDYVLIDAPPFGILTDATPLMNTADGVVLCVRFDQTRKHDLEHTLDNLNNIKVKIIGTVLTSFDHKRSTGYYYSSDYYRYAYESYNKYVSKESEKTV